MTTLYGIPNCDTVKKARQWLSDAGIDFQFHDFKKQGVPAEALARWAKQLGLDTLINKRGTTWRKLSPEQQAQAADLAGALALLAEQSSLIKRPILEHGATLNAGFDSTRYQEIFAR